MPRVVEHDPAAARRLDQAIAAIAEGTPVHPDLAAKAKKGSLRLNFSTVALEAGVARHQFDKPKSLYADQHAALVARMAEKGRAEPLASQLAECRSRLALATERLRRSQTYAGHLLAHTRELEVEVARLNELLAGRRDAGGDTLVGSSALLELPPPIPRRIGPGQGRKRAK
ncbi:hypothetical protein [Sphingomonas sp. CLY1604]|uniref:hypothetical protein n=1 Tax=Sphingomonas sp. CLY1604 TaxID=3457786 RepID=UPI003FD73D9A